MVSFPPFAVPSWMHKLKNGAYVSHKILERCLHPLMTEDAAHQAVLDAIQANILVQKTKNGRSKSKQNSICFTQKLVQHQNDPYCFECHKPGSAPLKKCLQCVRSFHVKCQRKNPLRPNYSVPSDKCQPHRLPLDESDIEEAIEEVPAPTIPMEKDVQIELDYNSNVNIIRRPPLKHESDSSDDVHFVSEQPARTRKRLSTYIKSEETPHSEASNELELCTPCRLLNSADLLNPPHVDTEELNCLLNYSWQKQHTWLTKDVRKYMAKHWSKRDSELVESALFKNDTLGLSDIAHNIEINKFNHLSEFLIDMLDLQHNIGVFFGTKGAEYGATKWLLRDITHDIREIHRCSDCYRNSNTSNSSPHWFAKPCTQRHELVYAKQRSSPYWPAKVIRVMKKTNKYDVRFFGGSHSRALISSSDIQSIDADISKLNNKMKCTNSFNAAMRELRCHMLLLRQPIYLFDFYADPTMTENAITNALQHSMQAPEVSAAIKRPRSATPGPAKKRKSTASSSKLGRTTPGIATRVQPMRRARSEAPEAMRRARSEAPQAARVTYSPTPAETNVAYRELVQEVVSLNEQLKRRKTELETMREQLNAVKRKRWCQHCLEEAEFDCCFNASYCSAKCKRRDKRRHQATCVSR